MANWPEPFVGAVSLTYDGSLPEHLSEAVPMLNECGVQATFFAYPPDFIIRLPAWREAASNGHEIGNGFARGYADKDGLIGSWAYQALAEECQEAEELFAPLGGGLKSFAYPCVRTEWGKNGMPVVGQVVRDSIVRLNHEVLAPISKTYRYVRHPLDGFNEPDSFSPKQLRCFNADTLDADSLCVLTHVGISKGAWTVLTFNGLNNTEFSHKEHSKFLKWLGARKQNVKIGSLAEVGAMLGSRVEAETFQS
jgi:peptidoglycan/xylan/chitin deacetylase (PgdA/CDA1 family)